MGRTRWQNKRFPGGPGFVRATNGKRTKHPQRCLRPMAATKRGPPRKGSRKVREVRKGRTGGKQTDSLAPTALAGGNHEPYEPHEKGGRGITRRRGETEAQRKWKKGRAAPSRGAASSRRRKDGGREAGWKQGSHGRKTPRDVREGRDGVYPGAKMASPISWQRRWRVALSRRPGCGGQRERKSMRPSSQRFFLGGERGREKLVPCAMCWEGEWQRGGIGAGKCEKLRNFIETHGMRVGGKRSRGVPHHGSMLRSLFHTMET